jgi:hypothetical protein
MWSCQGLTWIRLFRENGLVVEDLSELRPDWLAEEKCNFRQLFLGSGDEGPYAKRDLGAQRGRRLRSAADA